ncbi:hypothetical protein ACHAWF_009390 [Thalassiosira exigua]
MNLSNTYTTSLLAAAAVAAASSALASEPLAAKNQAKPAERLGQVVRRLAKSGKGEDRSTEPESEDRDCGLLDGSWVAYENITSVVYSDSLSGGIQYTTSEYFALQINVTGEGNTLTGINFFPHSTGSFFPEVNATIGNATMVGFHRSDCAFRLVSADSPMVIEGHINDDDFGTSLWIEDSGSGSEGAMAYGGMFGRQDPSFLKGSFISIALTPSSFADGPTRRIDLHAKLGYPLLLVKRFIPFHRAHLFVVRGRADTTHRSPCEACEFYHLPSVCVVLRPGPPVAARLELPSSPSRSPLRRSRSGRLNASISMRSE